jgi:hypothetical protein
MITKEQLNLDAKVIRKQNSANHGSPLIGSPWADIVDDDIINTDIPLQIQKVLQNGSVTLVDTKVFSDTVRDLNEWIEWWKRASCQGQSTPTPILPPIETPSLATKVPPPAPSPIKPLLAPLHSLNAPSPPLALNVTSDDQYYVRKSDDQYSTPDPTRPLGTGWRPRTKASANFRRIRAIEKGYFAPKTRDAQVSAQTSKEELPSDVNTPASSTPQAKAPSSTDYEKFRKIATPESSDDEVNTLDKAVYLAAQNFDVIKEAQPNPSPQPHATSELFPDNPNFEYDSSRCSTPPIFRTSDQIADTSKCLECRANIPDNSTFCYGCGTPRGQSIRPIKLIDKGKSPAPRNEPKVEEQRPHNFGKFKHPVDEAIEDMMNTIEGFKHNLKDAPPGFYDFCDPELRESIDQLFPEFQAQNSQTNSPEACRPINHEEGEEHMEEAISSSSKPRPPKKTTLLERPSEQPLLPLPPPSVGVDGDKSFSVIVNGQDQD